MWFRVGELVVDFVVCAVLEEFVGGFFWEVLDDFDGVT